MKPALPNIASITEEQIYNEFIRLGMEQLIAQDLSKRYYHNELTYRDLENLEKQFGLKFDNLIYKIDTVEKTLQKDISNLDAKIDSVEKNLNTKIDNLDAKIDNVEKNLKQDMSNLEQNLKQTLDEKLEINTKLLLEKIEISNRMITIMTAVVVPIAISAVAAIVVSLIAGFFK
ncbi:Borrelia Bdr family protein (plasmid) [Borreliella afzelii PKo]|uniref:Borrelia Bdr family protein n=1 Tax=Borreliella afzelii (strain PKo) TaxID=390236 RepID=G0IT60_BORAP|nr:repeat motif-containing gene [Borreliella afzelii ACA-1]AEL70314.1 Borrelia Bdr family protein [Borreliella afzelii PKo]